MSAATVTERAPTKTPVAEPAAAPAPVPEHPAAGSVPPAQANRPRAWRRRLLAAGFLACAAAGAAVWYLRGAGRVGTDDAFVEGHVIGVSPKVAAHVLAVHFNDNYLVHRGDLLVELDPRDFAVNVASAEANLAAARSRLTQAQAQQDVAGAGLGQATADLASAQANADNASADLKRNEQLMHGQVIGRREYDASVAGAKSAAAAAESAAKKIVSQQAQVHLADAERQTAEAEVQQAEAGLQQAHLQLSYARIIAPADGWITRKGVEPGNYVQPGQTLFSLVPADVWVIANFKETQLKRLAVGQPVTVRVDALPGTKLRAHVESFQTGTGSRFTLLPPENATGNFVKVVQRVPVKIVFDEPGSALARLWPGESVEPEVELNASPVSGVGPAQPLDPATL